MPKLRKLRRKQKYQYHVNRKRLHQKLTKMPDIKCEIVKKAWDEKKSLTDNLTSMGLVADPNNMKKMKIPSGKDSMKKMMLPASLRDESPDDEMEETPEKGHVVTELEKQAKDAYNSKNSTAHPLPKEMYRKLIAFLDKYGEDYEGMANDHTNYNQETPAQLRSQITRLKKIPQQWIPYLKSRGLVVPSQEEDNK